MNADDDITYESAPSRRQGGVTLAVMAREAERQRRAQQEERAREAEKTRRDRIAEAEAKQAAEAARQETESLLLRVETERKEAAERIERERLGAEHELAAELCDATAKAFEAVALPALNKLVEDAEAEARAASAGYEQLKVDAVATEREAVAMGADQDREAVAKLAIIEPALRLARLRAERARDATAAAKAKRDAAVSTENMRRTFVRLHQWTERHREAAKKAAESAQQFRKQVVVMIGCSALMEDLINRKLPHDADPRGWRFWHMWHDSKTRGGTEASNMLVCSEADTVKDIDACLQMVEREARRLALKRHGYTPDDDPPPATGKNSVTAVSAPSSAEPTPPEGGDISNSFAGAA